jgi:hypothetical protein
MMHDIIHIVLSLGLMYSYSLISKLRDGLAYQHARGDIMADMIVGINEKLYPGSVTRE